MKNYAQQMHDQIDALVTKIQSPLSRNERKKFNTGEELSGFHGYRPPVLS